MPNLAEIRRQREDWQREASMDFARHRTDEGLSAYAGRGRPLGGGCEPQRGRPSWGTYIADLDARPDGSRLALAHRRADVGDQRCHSRRAAASGALARGEPAGEFLYQTTKGNGPFAPGDRLLFRENNRDLGVKNGMLGTVEGAEPGRLEVRLDSAKRGGRPCACPCRWRNYAAVDHGYATTIHKAQGATVDRTFVLASETMDRHLTYVAMTRHRDGVQLYGSQAEFAGRNAGRLIEHGREPITTTQETAPAIS